MAYDKSLLDHPLREKLEVTPSDSAELSFVSRVLFVGVAGNIAFTLAGESDSVAPNALTVPAGWSIVANVKQVWSTNTTASDIWAFR